MIRLPVRPLPASFELHDLAERNSPPRFARRVVSADMTVFGRRVALISLVAPNLDTVDDQVVRVLLAADSVAMYNHGF
jgi:hypothetical protein